VRRDFSTGDVIPINKELKMGVKRILIAEDDHEVLNLLSILATKEGFSVVCVSDGIGLLTAMEKDDFDLIITDLMMVNLDGMAAIDILKKRGYTIPVIALTGRTHQETKDFEGKFDKIFRKPCNFRDLINYANSLIDRSEQLTTSFKIRPMCAP
jgi:DNA-binding response OmpR family regulator